MKKSKAAFTLLEFVFVIVIFGLVAKVAVDFFAQAYRSYLYTHLINRLSNSSGTAAEVIAKRLQYRIRSSVIVRHGKNGEFRSLENYAGGEYYDTLEWIGYDIESYRGNDTQTALWSGVIDKNASMATRNSIKVLITPGSNLDEVNTMVDALSNTNTSIADGAIYLFAAQHDVNSSFGWAGGESISGQSLDYAMHRVSEYNATAFSLDGNASELFEDLEEKGEWDSRYYFAWSAYAVRIDDGNLTLYYDYQPWEGESLSDATTKKQVLMEHVNTFKMLQREGVMKIQVCVSNDDMNGSTDSDIEGFAICKEKTVY